MNKSSALGQVAREIDRVGQNVAFYFRPKSDVTTDIYGARKGATGSSDYTVKAYPIRYTPTRQQLDAAGIRQEVDAIIYTAKKDWNAATPAITFEQMPLGTSSAVVDSQDYEIRDKGLVSQHEDDYAYITFGLSRRTQAR